MKALHIGLGAVALVALGGCATRNADSLPPAPAGTTAPADAAGAGPGAGQAGSTPGSDAVVGTGATVGPDGDPAVAGTRANFIAAVPSDRIFFDLDQSSLDGEDETVLRAHAQYLQRNPGVRVTVEGHADERGTREYNLALGERRANAAKTFLVSQGIAEQRIGTISYGKERPDATGSDEGSWARNRRAVTVTVQ